MREIKFRAWDLKTKTMHTIENINFCGRETVTVQYNPIKKISLDSVYLMQYIGVQDKSGVEIYEGDVIRHPTGKYGPDFVIQWSPILCGFTAVQVESGHPSPQLNQGTMCHFEVIGNIYENPELVSNEADS